MKSEPTTGGTNISDRYDQREEISAISLIDVENATRKFFNCDRSNHIELLSGGYSNANYLFNCKNERFVLRFFTKNLHAAEQEINILKLAKENGILAPEVIDFKIINGRAVAVFRFIEGILLSSLLSTHNNITTGIFTTIGTELARIHSVKFPAAGYIGAKDHIVQEFPDFCKEAKEFLFTMLNGIAGTRLEPGLIQRLRETVEQYWHLVYETYKGPTLVHCDFNPKNILLTLLPESQIAAILDWEFSMAGHPLIDLGNFFRFAKDDYQSDARAAFSLGYQQSGGELPEDWEKAALLLDLTSMVDFLSREKEYPKTFRTARTIIESTLKESETWK